MQYPPGGVHRSVNATLWGLIRSLGEAYCSERTSKYSCGLILIGRVDCLRVHRDSGGIMLGRESIHISG